jgi:hypothetical protein
MKVIALFISVLFTVAGYAQNTLNNFKYVLVPEKFEIFKTENQYGLNTLTKLLLEDKGFTVFMASEQLPPQLAANKCSALKAELVDKKGFFVTTVTLVLKDCQGNIIFKGKEGKSREKEWQAAYDEALRDSYTALKSAPYSYDSTAAVQQQVAVAQPAQPTQPAQQQPTTSAPAPAPAQASTADISGILYAQATANGYQLIDTAPKKVLTLLKTSLPDQYIAEGGPAGGIVFKKNEEWVFEYYKDNKLVSQKLNIKF